MINLLDVIDEFYF